MKAVARLLCYLGLFGIVAPRSSASFSSGVAVCICGVGFLHLT